MMSEEEKTASKTIFGGTVREWVIVVALLGTFAGNMLNVFIGGTPNSTNAAITDQTEALITSLDQLRGEIRLNSQLAQRNALKIGDVEASNMAINKRMDSLYQTLMDGLENLDGYFRGRLDQLRPSPSK